MEVLDRHHHHHHHTGAASHFPPRKRKAEAQDAHNERLSKRLSLLNLEQNGTKLYVPVESTNVSSVPGQVPAVPVSLPRSSQRPRLTTSRSATSSTREDDSVMQLDDTKHKVYIYNLDDELSSESEPEDAKLVFLPDIEKHLRQNRIHHIPPPILPNSDGELAGKQLVLYSVPSSLSIPQEHDSVRKAIIEARARARANANVKASTSICTSTNTSADTSPKGERREATLPAPMVYPPETVSLTRDDPDAMDLD